MDHSTLRKLETGIYEDEQGRYLHLCLVEVCEAAGYPADSEHLDIAEEMLRAIMAKKWPHVPVLVEPPSERAPTKNEVH